MWAASTPIKPSTKRSEKPQTQHSGKIGFEHRRPKCHVATTGGDRGAQLEADRFEGLVV
jgi:hypothetical protein